MAFMNKETLESEARRLQLDLTGMNWNEMQAAVTKAQAASSTSPPSPNKGRFKNPLDQYIGKKILLSPEMASTPHQLIKYDEDLGEEISAEEQKVWLGILKEQGKEHIDSTYVIKGKTGKRTIAQSTLPKQNAKLIFDPNKDVAVVASFKGRTGYLWTHQRLPNIKDILQKSGYLGEYQNRFSGEQGTLFYVNALLCCDIELAHTVMKEIERKHAARKRQGDFA